MLAPGTIVDKKYRIISMIGMGGFGAVYKAEQLGFERLVALKMLQHQGLPSSVDQKRFEQEARLLSSIKHRNLVLFYGYGVWNGCPYIAMEYVDGRALQTHLSANQEMPVAETLAMCKQILSALGSIHAHGFIHRDLKPANILLTRDTESGGTPVLKLIDFGLAKILQAAGVTSQKLTETGLVVGTVEYIAPEQCMGQPSDGRADIYSVGCIMYRCLTGKVPFSGDDTFAILKQHVNDNPPELEVANSNVHFADGLQAIVDKSMAKNPAERFQNTAEMLSAIAAVESGKTPNLSTPKKLRHSALPKWLMPLVATCGVLAAVVGGSYFAWSKLAAKSHKQSASSVDAYNDVEHFVTSVTDSQEWPDVHSWQTAFAKPDIGKKAEQLYRNVIDANQQDHLLDDDERKLGVVYGRYADIKLTRGDSKSCMRYEELAIPLMIKGREFDSELECAMQCYEQAAVNLHQPEKAERMQREIIAAWPMTSRVTPVGVVANFAVFLSHQGRYQEAIELAQPYFTRYPESRSSYLGTIIEGARQAMLAKHR